MARARLLKPGFFVNEELAEVSPWGRLLYAGLWTLADREGRLEDRAKRIKASLFPYDDVDVDQLLDELAMLGFVVRYQADDKACLSIPTFLAHQHPHVREPASTIPAPTQPSACTDLALTQHQPGPAESLYGEGTETETEAERPRDFDGSGFQEKYLTIETYCEMVSKADYESAKQIAEAHNLDDINAALIRVRHRKKSSRIYVSELWRELEPEEPNGTANQRRRPGSVVVSNGSDWEAADRARDLLPRRSG